MNISSMYKRILQLQDPKRSFFLWGQRQTGKTTLLKKVFPNVKHINLLHSDEFLSYSTNPSLLRERLSVTDSGSIVIIDEVQKVPLLLDEVHDLIESKKLIFGLCGSSARKLKRGQANLLGGRALKFELRGFSAYELGEKFNLQKVVNRGYLPPHYLDDDYLLQLRSYVSDYLKEEILAEGLIRNLPVFSRFLEVAAIGDTELLNYSNIGRETGVSPKTVQSYFEILQDTLIGSFLPAFTKRAKRRIIQKPKFYFNDVGIVNFLARRHQIEFKTPLFGKAFENWVFHELQCFIKYSLSDYPIYFWQLTTGVEVDFILGDMEIALEAKGVDRVTSDNLKNLRQLKIEHPYVKEQIVVCLEKEIRQTDDGILILPYQDFIKRLWYNPVKQDVTISLKSV